jgi:hypothetical protein
MAKYDIARWMKAKLLQIGEPIPFDRSFSGAPGEVVRLSSLVRRIVAPNPGPMTFTGTCTYAVGQGEIAVIDPGPASETTLPRFFRLLAPRQSR